jgi:hypothetical protein
VAIDMAARVTKRQVDELIEEVEAYLGAVDVFRAEGCEPRWRGDAMQPVGAETPPSRPRRRSRKT